MPKIIIFSIAFVFCALTNIYAQDDYDTKARAYIDKYKHLAIKEQIRSGVPAAITLAQGIHETSAGCSELATEANNHFGIKCKKDWTGLTFTHTDDAPNECFRKYLKAEDSYLDHSDYLLTNRRYAGLFDYSLTDYKAWATGLKRCGYATNPKYAQVLTKIIEDYNLQEFTLAAIDGEDDKTQLIAVKEVVPENDAPVAAAIEEPKEVTSTKPAYGAVVKVNDLKAVYAKKGEMPLEYAIKNNIRYERFLEINEISEMPLQRDMFLYLEKKHTQGLIPTYTVRLGENLAMIAQAKGIQQKSLRTLNNLADGEEPAAGATILLQKRPEDKHKLTIEVPQFNTSKSKIKVVNELQDTIPAKKEPEIIAAAPTEIVDTQLAIAVKEIPTPDTQTVAAAAIAEVGDTFTTAPVNAAIDTSMYVSTKTPAVETVPQADITVSTIPVDTVTVIPVASEPVKEIITPTVQAETVPDTSMYISTKAIASANDTPIVTQAVLITEVPAQTIAETAPAETVATQTDTVQVASVDVPNPIEEPASSPINNDTDTATKPVEKSTANLPVPDSSFITKEQIEASASLPVGPPTSVNDIPAAPPKPQQIPVQPTQAQITPVEPPQPEEPPKPKTELDILKSKFDKVVYATRLPKKDTLVVTTTTQPETTTTPPPAAIPKEEPAVKQIVIPNSAKFHVVKKGDTAFSIAKEYGITITELRSWNELDFSAIKVGQKLRVKAPN